MALLCSPWAYMLSLSRSSGTGVGMRATLAWDHSRECSQRNQGPRDQAMRAVGVGGCFYNPLIAVFVMIHFYARKGLYFLFVCLLQAWFSGLPDAVVCFD